MDLRCFFFRKRFRGSFTPGDQQSNNNNPAVKKIKKRKWQRSNMKYVEEHQKKQQQEMQTISYLYLVPTNNSQGKAAALNK